MISFIKKLFFISIWCASFYTYFYAEGLVGGSLVATPHGLVPVEILQKQDTVIGYDCVGEQYVADIIIAITKVQSSHVIRINLESDVLEVSPEQQFYDQKSNSWIPAGQLTSEHTLFTHSSTNARVLSTDTIEKDVEFFRITTQKFHNFFVSKNQILTHNFMLVAAIPLISITAAEVITTCLPYVAGVLGCIWFKPWQSKSHSFSFPKLDPNKMFHIFNNPMHNFNGLDPEDILKKIEAMLQKATLEGKVLNNQEFLVEEYIEGLQRILGAKGIVINGAIRLGTAWLKKN